MRPLLCFMYVDEKYDKCRPVLTCERYRDGAPCTMEKFFMCPDFLIFPAKKSLNIWKSGKFVYSLSGRRASIYGLSLNYQWISGRLLSGFIFLFFRKSSDTVYITSSLVREEGLLYPLAVCGTWICYARMSPELFSYRLIIIQPS